jgi:hypothetical protein
LFAVVSLFAMHGCSGLSALNPFSSSSTGPFTGTWTGSINPTFTTAGTLQLVLTQSSSQVTGTWTLTLSNASQNDNGSVSGTISGSSLSANLQPGVPTNCSETVSATLNGSTQLTGTMASNVCSGGFGSTAITLNKQ